MKKTHIILMLLVVGILAILGAHMTGYFVIEPEAEVESRCKVSKMTYYYADWCGWCRRVVEDGTISKLEELGVNVTKVNVDFGPILHQFRGVPTFVINDEIYSGYKTFEQLKELLGCE